MKKTRTSLGLVALIALGGTVACGGDDGDNGGTEPADTGMVSETTPPDTSVPDTEVPDTGTPETTADTSMPMDADATAMTTPTLDFQIVNVSDWHGQIDPLSETDALTTEQADYGGVPVLSTILKTERAKKPTIFATEGDVTGATPSLSTKGTDIIDEPAILSMNFLGLQVDTLGNHNFDRGIGAYTTLIDKAKYVVTSGNLKNLDNTEMTCNPMMTGPCGIPGNKPDASQRVVKPYHIIKVGTGENTVNVAFIGLTNPDAPKLQFPGQMGKLVIEDPTAKANELSAAARAAGAHVVVVLIHHGATDFDPVAMKPTGPLIDYVAGIKAGAVDLVLGDHTNQRVETVINGIRVIENLSSGRTYGISNIKVVKGKVESVDAKVYDTLGKLSNKNDILIDSTTMKPQVCNSTNPCPTSTPAWTCSSTTTANGACRRAHNCKTGGTTTCPTGYTCSTDGTTCTKVVVAGDPAADALIAPWKATLSAKYDVKVATTTGDYLRGPTCPPASTCPPTPTVYMERQYQQPIGDLVTDALLDKFGPLGAKIAITNGGGLRSSIPSSYKPSVFSAVTAAGTTPPTITLSGTPAAAYTMKIEVTTGGAIGTMVFRWSSDGGTTWTSGVNSAATPIALGSTGVSVTFPAGTYATDNTYTFTTKKFVRSGCSTTNPCDVLLGDIFTVLPFQNKSTIRPVTAQTLWQALENGVGKKPAADGRFLQVAGFKFSFSAGAAEGARVQSIVLNDGTVIMDLKAATPVMPDAGKICTADTDCTGGSFGTAFTCVEDVDLKKRCMIKVVTNDFVNAGGETTPFKAGSKLGQIFNDMGDDVLEYVKKLATLTPGTHNFTAPSTTATTTRVIELP